MCPSKAPKIGCRPTEQLGLEMSTSHITDMFRSKVGIMPSSTEPGSTRGRREFVSGIHPPSQATTVVSILVGLAVVSAMARLCCQYVQALQADNNARQEEVT